MSATSARGSSVGTVASAVTSRLEKLSPYQSLLAAGGIGALGVRALRLAVVPPYPWFREAIIEMSLIIRRCLVPLAIALLTFTIGFGFFVLGGITQVIGASDREGGAIILGFVREASIWLTGMVIAGVAGSAIASDLGARKIRDELDALAVLGVDQTRTLVVPKVVGTILAAPVLGLIAILMFEVFNAILAPGKFGFSFGVLFVASKGSLIVLDLYGCLIRFLIIGVFVSTVACYKGLNSSGGTEGVGTAVNQAVVITFFGVWLLDAMFNLAYLSLFPQSQVAFKG